MFGFRGFEDALLKNHGFSQNASEYQDRVWGLGLLCPEITGQGREVDFHTLERRLGFRVEGLGSGVMATFGISPQAKKLKVSRPLKSQEKCALAQ